MIQTLRLLALAVLVASPTVAGADSFTPAQRAEIVTILRNALRTDPSILRDAVEALRAEEAAQEQAAAQSAIAALAPALTHTETDPVAGNPAGDVTVVEFFDVRCPYCRRMLPTMAELLRRDRNVRLVYKDIPILGPGSLLGARADMAAQKQNGYLRLHDILMAGTPDITPEVLRAAAAKAGLDWDRLQRDMNDPSVQSRIQVNLDLAHRLEIQGTPAYVIGNRMVSGAVDLADLQSAVAQARAVR